MSTVLRFKATIQIKGVNPYVLVTAAMAQRLQTHWRKPMPVMVQINGKPDEPWRINMMPVGTGDFYLYLHNDVRQASQTKVGDTVLVNVWFDEAYQSGPIHDMPPAFAAALQHNALASERWNALAPSRQKEVLRYMTGLTSEAAIARNVHGAIEALTSKTAHFMGRDWMNGA